VVTITIWALYLHRKRLHKVVSNCIANLKCAGQPHTTLTDVPLSCIAMTDGSDKWWKNCENTNCVLLLLSLLLLLWYVIWTFIVRLKHNILTIMFRWLPPSSGKIKERPILGAPLDKDTQKAALSNGPKEYACTFCTFRWRQSLYLKQLPLKLCLNDTTYKKSKSCAIINYGNNYQTTGEETVCSVTWD
jgi:hypothetical protein